MKKGFSKNGYKADSKDRHNPVNIIPSGRITMQGVPHPVFGIDSMGNKMMMFPGGEYAFPGDYVTEYPIRQTGGEAKPQVRYTDEKKFKVAQELYQDSLGLYNAYQFHNTNFNPFPDLQRIINYDTRTNGPYKGLTPEQALARSKQEYGNLGRPGDMYKMIKKRGPLPTSNTGTNKGVYDHYKGMSFNRPVIVEDGESPAIYHRDIQPVSQEFDGTGHHPVYQDPRVVPVYEPVVDTLPAKKIDLEKTLGLPPRIITPMSKTPKLKPGEIVLPGSRTEWLQTPSGTWYPRERPADGPVYNINTGGTRRMQDGGPIFPSQKEMGGLFKKTAQQMAKQFGSSKAPQNVTTEEMVGYKNNMFTNKMAQNAFMALAAEEASNMQDMLFPVHTGSFQDGGNVDHPMYPINTGGDPNVTDPNAYGYRDPLDGSNESMQHQGGRPIFPGQYGDINWFAQQDNQFRMKQENRPIEELQRVEADGTLWQASYNPDNLSGGTSDVGFFESARHARHLNKMNRQNDLGYQKIKPGAFKAKASNDVASFQFGGSQDYNANQSNAGAYFDAYEAMENQSSNAFGNFIGASGQLTGSVYANPAELRLKKLRTHITDPAVQQQYDAYQQGMDMNPELSTPDPWDTYNQHIQNLQQTNNPISMEDLFPVMQYGGYTPVIPNIQSDPQGGIGQSLGSSGYIPVQTPDGRQHWVSNPEQALQIKLNYEKQMQSGYQPAPVVPAAGTPAPRVVYPPVPAKPRSTSSSSGSRKSSAGSASSATDDIKTFTHEDVVGSNSSSTEASTSVGTPRRGNYVDQSPTTGAQSTQSRNAGVFVTQPGYYPSGGYNLFPTNTRWQRGQGMNVGPAVAYNPMNTYLDEYTYKGRLFGKGPRKVEMRFSHYGEPGIPNNQQPVTNPTQSAAPVLTPGNPRSATPGGYVPPAQNTHPAYDADNGATYYGTEMGSSPMGSAHGYMDFIEDLNQQVPNINPAMFRGFSTFEDGGEFSNQPMYPGAHPMNTHTFFFQNGGAMPVGSPQAGQPWGYTDAVWKRGMAGAGQDWADWGLAGMSMVSSFGEANERKQLEQQMQQRLLGDAVFNPYGAGDASRGSWTVNRGDFRPDDQTPVQFQGWNQGMIGSPMTQFQQGGEYYLSDDEIAQVMRMGGQIEYLD